MRSSFSRHRSLPPALGWFLFIDEAMSQIGVLPCYKRYCTIDVKKDEEFCAMLVDDFDEEVVFYTAEELAQVEVPNPSNTVQKHVGTPVFVKLLPFLAPITANSSFLK